jgi:hypothetical protein
MKRSKKNKDDSTLLDVFKQGERVYRICYNPDGTKSEYSGRIIKITEHCIAVHWDAVDGNPLSDFRIVYNILHESEVLNGKENTSPIKKENE